MVSGRIPAGKLVRQACERHIRDLDRADIIWNEDKAQRAIRFFSFLRHSKGEWAGHPFGLEPWQKFIVGSLFGWERLDGQRRFRVAYIEVPRKNGKSLLAAGIGILLAFFDDERGAEVYAAATKRDQAKIVWGDARAMVLRSSDLKSRINVLVGNLNVEATRSKFEPLGADTDGMDGLNVHGVVVDELHAHKTRAMWDVLQTATGARRQPLTFAITTAGYDRHSVCWDQHHYGIQINEGILEDDTFFAYIATWDEGDDWRDPASWQKANPNYGISVKPDDLQRKCEKAKALPSEQNAFLRLHGDVWTEQSTRWLDMELWDHGKDPIDPDSLQGRRCFAGLDLAWTKDLSALALLFPPKEKNERWKVLMRFWCPDAGIYERSRKDGIPYDLWARAGLIVATPGNATDYDFIEAETIKLAGKYQIQEIAFDRMFAGEIVTHLQEEGLTMVPFGQGFLSMAAPTAELERMLLASELQHGAHPILRWNASNVTVKLDSAGNLKPDKEASTEKIDGITALIMAIARAVQYQPAKRSVYESRGVVLLD